MVQVMTVLEMLVLTVLNWELLMLEGFVMVSLEMMPIPMILEMMPLMGMELKIHEDARIFACYSQLDY